ncbi:MAG: FtsX-like permease family protein [Leptothrix sp. (in: b-proteobacteria)]
MGWRPTALERHLIAAEWRHHPARVAVALLAIALGVALALAVQLINASALAEFGQAMHSVNGQPDLVLQAGGSAGLDEALYARVAAHPQVAHASPVLEIDTYAVSADGHRVALSVLGIDALQIAPISPALLPRPVAGLDRLAIIDPELVFLNPAARQALGLTARDTTPAASAVPARAGLPTLTLHSGQQRLSLRVAGDVLAAGRPLAVLDLAGAQAGFGRLGQLSRIDLRLVPGADRTALLRELALPPGVRSAAPDEAQQRVSNLSRSYRVNLSVLALVALFTGAFLVYAVQALAVAKRVPQLALLGVLGLDAAGRRRLVWIESAALGLAGSALGLALGTALAQLALQQLGGDLGSGLLGSSAPALHWDGATALLYGALGTAAALAGGWLPARAAERLAPAQSLKGLGQAEHDPHRAPSPPTPLPHGARGVRTCRWPGVLGSLSPHGRGLGRGLPRPEPDTLLGPALLLLGVLLAFLPPLGDLPLAAYLAVGCILLGGIACVPALVGAALTRLTPPRHPIWLLAVERARDQRSSATASVAGVVASLALSVALTVMVASFRDSVTHWLEQVLPADLYVRTAATSSAADSAWLPETMLRTAAQLPGVTRVQAQRIVPITLDPNRPPVSLIARPLRAEPTPAKTASSPPGADALAASLPLVGALRPPHPTLPNVAVTETLAALYQVGPGDTLLLPLPDGRRVPVFVRALWRDYARQQGALAIDRQDWQALSGDTRINDLALWLAPGQPVGAVEDALRVLAGDTDRTLLEFGTPGQIRTSSLAIFDRSFAITYWLQAVAIGIGLFGIAASTSAQVLARRKEFGALRHLGYTRRQVLALVGAEGLLWSAVGALLGVALGLAISVILVHVVNPQSFHWTMELSLPLGRLALLAGSVLLAGTLTALLAGRAAASRDLALAVKEDW